MKLIKIDADNYINVEAIANIGVKDFFDYPDYENPTGKKVEITTANDSYIMLKIFDAPNADNEKAARQYLIETVNKINAEGNQNARRPMDTTSN